MRKSKLILYWKLYSFRTRWPFLSLLSGPSIANIIYLFSSDILLQEQIEKASNEREEVGRKLRGKRHKLTLTPATSHSKIPSRWQEAPATATTSQPTIKPPAGTQSLYAPSSLPYSRQAPTDGKPKQMLKCRSDPSLSQAARNWALRPVSRGGGEF